MTSNSQPAFLLKKDLKMITNGMEDKTKNYKLDVDCDWTPARAVSTEKGVGSTNV